MFQKILVPLAGSDQSGQIVNWASGLARGLGSEVVLLSVVDPDDVNLPSTDPDHDRFGSTAAGSGVYDHPGDEATRGAAPSPIASTPVTGVTQNTHSSTGASAYGTQLLEGAAEHVRQYLMAEASKVTDAGGSASVEVAIGNPADEIGNAAERLGVDAVAMATRRESALARGILGSVTDRVLHTTNLPMLVIHADSNNKEGAAGSPGTVIVPLDGSLLSEQAVPVAREIAGAVGAKILFLRSTASAFMGVADAGANYIPTNYGTDEDRDDVSTYLQRFVIGASDAGIEAEALALTGSVVNAIVETAEASHEGLIVMSTHGRSGFKRFLLGSVADKVVRSSGTPVLVLPPE